MLEVIHILAKEYIYLNLTTLIVCGAQKLYTIEYITHNNVLIVEPTKYFSVNSNIKVTLFLKHIIVITLDLTKCCVKTIYYQYDFNK